MDEDNQTQYKIPDSYLCYHCEYVNKKLTAEKTCEQCGKPVWEMLAIPCRLMTMTPRASKSQRSTLKRTAGQIVKDDNSLLVSRVRELEAELARLKVTTPAPISNGKHAPAVQVSTLEQRIELERVYGARFLPGTKNPRYFEHIARLKALESEGV